MAKVIDYQRAHQIRAADSSGILNNIRNTNKDIIASLGGMVNTGEEALEDYVTNATDKFQVQAAQLKTDEARKALLANSDQSFLDLDDISKGFVDAQNQDFRVSAEGRAVAAEGRAVTADERDILQDAVTLDTTKETLRHSKEINPVSLDQAIQSLDASKKEAAHLEALRPGALIKQGQEITKNSLDTFGQLQDIDLAEKINPLKVEGEQYKTKSAKYQSISDKRGLKYKREEHEALKQDAINKQRIFEQESQALSDARKRAQTKDEQDKIDNAQKNLETKRINDEYDNNVAYKALKLANDQAREENVRKDRTDKIAVQDSIAAFQPSGNLDNDIAAYDVLRQGAIDGRMSEENKALLKPIEDRLVDRYSTDIDARLERLTGESTSTLKENAYTFDLYKQLRDGIVGNLGQPSKFHWMTESQLETIADKAINDNNPAKIKFRRVTQALELKNKLEARSRETVAKKYDLNQEDIETLNRDPEASIYDRVQTRLKDVDWDKENIRALRNSISNTFIKLRKALPGLSLEGQEQLNLGVLDLYAKANFNQDYIPYNHNDFSLADDKETDISDREIPALFQVIQRSFGKKTDLGDAIAAIDAATAEANKKKSQLEKSAEKVTPKGLTKEEYRAKKKANLKKYEQNLKNALSPDPEAVAKLEAAIAALDPNDPKDAIQLKRYNRVNDVKKFFGFGK